MSTVAEVVKGLVFATPATAGVKVLKLDLKLDEARANIASGDRSRFPWVHTSPKGKQGLRRSARSDPAIGSSGTDAKLEEYANLKHTRRLEPTIGSSGTDRICGKQSVWGLLQLPPRAYFILLNLSPGNPPTRA
mgnify:CR=1 FL=1